MLFYLVVIALFVQSIILSQSNFFTLRKIDQLPIDDIAFQHWLQACPGFFNTGINRPLDLQVHEPWRIYFSIGHVFCERVCHRLFPVRVPRNRAAKLRIWKNQYIRVKTNFFSQFFINII